jgi:predicted ATPase/signal transduction histidine kinase/GAF domain-containing protein
MNAIAHLPGYQISELLYAGCRSLVYRGIRESDWQPVVIKILRNPFPDFQELVLFRNQYTITRNLDIPGVVQPLALEPYQNGYALVMEDFQGVSLRDWLHQEGNLRNPPERLGDFFGIALQIVEALSGIHHELVIHKDIKPANILINPETRQVKLTDFGIASLLPRETQEIHTASALEGTLAYLSPEQTGRMNRGIDYRSDFYALGVTFYEMLTGQLPFTSDDPMELVHCHLAKQPVPVHHLNSQVPPGLAAIVSKLMAKNAEDRYQSALGLKHDLERCQERWQEHQWIEPFDLGQRDLCDRFLIPEKLYGRETEVQTLLDAFARVAHPASPTPPNSELVLVTGFSGIGKTAVVNEVHKPIVKQRGYFIKGKFDQLNRNIPFSALVQALRDLMRQLLGESDSQLQVWRSQILAALGSSGQVMIDVVPELEQIIGPQPAAVELSGTAAQNRFNLLFQRFIQVFATPDHPLVIFLDDLQWVDSASLSLMYLLLTGGQTGHLLLIGAYRDNEVSPAHPLMLALDELANTGATVNTITLQPLSHKSINQLVADTLNCAKAVAQPLTELTYQKTGGNPFFATQFLQALYQDGLIQFDSQAGCWQCDLVRVQDAALTEDVVAFMASQLQKLPPATQTLLTLAACIGNQFDLATLAIVSQQSDIETATVLWPALQRSLILPQSQIYKFFQEEPKGGKSYSAALGTQASGSCGYRFLHDRVQQAAYSLIPEDQKQATHYRIGQLLLQQISPEEQGDRIFELVNQLNYGTALITGEGDRLRLAELNLMACRKAKAATAYQASQDYATMGLALLGDGPWHQHYSLTLSLHELAAELASLCGDFARMDQLINTVTQEAHDLLEQVHVYRIRILANVYQNNLAAAIAIGQEILHQLGVQFPTSPTPEDIQQEIAAIADLIGDRPIADLVNLPEMGDRTALAIIQIASSLLGTTFLSGSPLFPLLVSLGVKLSIQSGNTAASPVCYAFYGATLCNLLKDVNTGSQFGQLALQLVAETEASAAKPEVFSPVIAFIRHRTAHLRELLPLSREGYAAGLDVGSLEYAGYNAILYCINGFGCGQPLAVLEPEVRAYARGLEHLHQVTAANYCWIIWQTILNLMGATEHPTVLSGEALQEAEFLPTLVAANDPGKLFQFHIYKAMLCFLFEDMVTAREQITEAQRYFKGAAGLVNEATLYFYDSLVTLAQVDPVNDDTDAALQRVTENQTQLRQFWAHYAPMNYQHKADLVEAECWRVLGKNYEAGDWYDRAIAGARENGYIQEEAIANELAAKFYLRWGKDKVAAGYMQEAYYGYARWGAKAKTDDLEQRYPHLLTAIFQSRRNACITGKTTQQEAGATPDPDQYLPFSTSNYCFPVPNLDFATILRAVHVLSSEMQLDQLISILLRVVMENSGAQKAALLIHHDDTLTIEDIAILQDDGGMHLSVPLCASDALPMSVINYVKNSLEAIVLDDATKQTDFIADPYLVASQARSILCTPILKQGKLIGLLYLENPLTAGVFTRDRLEVVQLLCTQAAISLENARLYGTLQTSEARYQRLAENVPGVIYRFRMSQTGDQEFLYISPGCIEMFELPPDDILANPQALLQQMIHPEDLTRLQQSVLDSAQALEPWQWIGRIQLPSGPVKWIQGMSRPERQPDGTVVWDGILMDISDRKQAEAQIQQQQQLLHTVIDTVPNLIFVKDWEGRYVVANQAIAEFYNTTVDALLGKTDAELHPYSEEVERFVQENRAVIESGQPMFIPEEEVSIAPGLGEWLQWQKHPLQVPGVDGLCVLGVGVYITARKQAEAEIRQLNEALEQQNRNLEALVVQRTEELMQRTDQLEASNQELELFSYSVSHDLRAPLRHISGFVHALQQRLAGSEVLTDPKVGHYLHIIEASSQKMALLIDGLLTLSRIGRKPMQSKPVPLRQLVDEAIALTQSNPDLTTPVEFVISELPTVQGDATLLQQVLSNLIGNAAKFSRHHPSPCVEVGALPDGTVFVRDNGVGFDMEYADKLFGVFQRLHSQTDFEGTGIGLAIVQRIIHRHNGEIWAESQPHQGATFYFKIGTNRIDVLAD